MIDAPVNVTSAGVRAVTFEALSMGIKNASASRSAALITEGQRPQRHHRAGIAEIAQR
jgi:hypothetical protein